MNFSGIHPVTTLIKKKCSSFQSYLSPFFTLSLFSLLCSISFFSLAYLSHSCLYPLPDQTFTLAQSSDRITTSQKGHCIGVYRVQCIVYSVQCVQCSLQCVGWFKVKGIGHIKPEHTTFLYVVVCIVPYDMYLYKNKNCLIYFLKIKHI